jgi:hypothetical protein
VNLAAEADPRSVVARAVPPVASRSSTISTRCPLATASPCILSESVPSVGRG